MSWWQRLRAWWDDRRQPRMSAAWLRQFHLEEIRRQHGIYRA